MNAIGDAIRNATGYLKEHPDEARYTDSAAVAVLEDGLRVSVMEADGQMKRITTDMPKSVGGTDTAPSPGWLFRASLAACDTTLIAMAAAMRGIEVTSVEVTIDSESNDYGILGIDDSVPAGPLSVRTKVRVGAKDADPSTIREMVEWAVDHCPVCDATKRAIPLSLEIEPVS